MTATAVTIPKNFQLRTESFGTELTAEVLVKVFVCEVWLMIFILFSPTQNLSPEARLRMLLWRLSKKIQENLRDIE